MMRRISRGIINRSLVLLVLMSPALALSDNGWPTYKGAWFSVRHPPEFEVRPSLRSLSAVQGYDSAFFIGPDAEVEFYAFSPQWNGEPKDIAFNPLTEEYVSQKEERKGGKQIRWATIKARDNKYLKSFVDTEDKHLNTRKVFAIRYRDQQA